LEVKWDGFAIVSTENDLRTTPEAEAAGILTN
jgi:hypothetical protein